MYIRSVYSIGGSTVRGPFMNPAKFVGEPPIPPHPPEDSDWDERDVKPETPAPSDVIREVRPDTPVPDDVVPIGSKVEVSGVEIHLLGDNGYPVFLRDLTKEQVPLQMKHYDSPGGVIEGYNQYGEWRLVNTTLIRHVKPATRLI